MRRPRNKKSWDDYSKIVGLRSKERFLESIEFHGDVRVALIYPNEYAVASSSLATHALLKKLNSLNNIRAERFFHNYGLEKYYSLDSLTPLDEFKVWAFSVNFELDILRVFEILRKFSIPLARKERTRAHPVILIGGAMTYFNDSLICEVADVVHRGDLTREFLYNLSQARATMKKEELISILASGGQTVWLDGELAQSVFLTPDSVFGNRFLLELGRGCQRKCRFCVSGYNFGRARYRELEETISIMEDASKFTKRFGLVAATVTDYPHIEALAQHCIDREYDLSVSSLRLDALTKTLFEALKTGNQNLFTIAPEGGSQRMRNLFGKGIDQQAIIEALEMGLESGFKKVKLYYIYGAIFEETSDRKGISELAKLALDMGYSRVILSLNPLIPKPGTPFESLPMEEFDRLKKIEKELKNDLAIKGIKSDFESLRESTVQYALANIDRASSSTLLEHLKEEEKAIPFLQKYAAELNFKRKEWEKYGKKEHSGCR